jgi:hypothetical protein
MHRNSDKAVARALDEMGIKTGSPSDAISAEFARGMFDTTGTVDPFSDDSPIKQAPITDFPKQFFLVLRVVQLMRGLASRMDVEFGLADQWRPFAEAALARDGGERGASPLPERQGKYYGI